MKVSYTYIINTVKLPFDIYTYHPIYTYIYIQ